MTKLTVRNLPDDIHRALHVRAAAAATAWKPGCGTSFDLRSARTIE